MSSDLYLTLSKPTFQLLPQRPFVTFREGKIDRGLEEYFGLTSQPEIIVTLTDNSLLEKTFRKLTELNRFEPSQNFGYLTLHGSGKLRINLGLPENEASALIESMMPFFGGQSEFYVRLDATDLVAEGQGVAGREFRSALIDGKFKMSVSAMGS